MANLLHTKYSLRSLQKIDVMLRNIFFIALVCYPSAFYIEKRVNFIPKNNNNKESNVANHVCRRLRIFWGFKAIREEK